MNAHLNAGLGVTLPCMTLTFAALDVETANSARGSICSVGVAVVHDGVLVESWHRLVQPPEGLRHFDAMNSYLHGLGPADVAGQLAWLSD